MVVDGQTYEPKYWSCATDDCLRLANNLDMSDPASIAFQKALTKSTLDGLQRSLNYGLLVTPTGIAGSVLGNAGLTVAGGLVATGNSSVYDETLKLLSQGVSQSLFVNVLMHRPAEAVRFVAAIDLAGGYDAFVRAVKAEGFVPPANSKVPPWLHRVDPPRKP